MILELIARGARGQGHFNLPQENEIEKQNCK
jgi:hypothetical protein